MPKWTLGQDNEASNASNVIFFHFFFQDIPCGTECLSSEEAHLVDKKVIDQGHEARERPFINKPESKAESVSGKHQK